MRRRNYLGSYISWFVVVYSRLGSSLPSPTRRIRWEGSKGMIGAGGVQVRAADDGREVGGGSRFLNFFGFLRFAIVKPFGWDKAIVHPSALSGRRV